MTDLATGESRQVPHTVAQGQGLDDAPIGCAFDETLVEQRVHIAGTLDLALVPRDGSDS